jgi:Spy/CpxP family protein refolding chaperone
MPSAAVIKTTRTASVTALVLVFLCGAVVGAVGMNLRSHNHSAFWTETGKAAYLERVKKDLDLTPSQVEEMEMILDDFSKYYRTVLSDGKSRIMQLLKPEQREKFEHMMQQERRRP